MKIVQYANDTSILATTDSSVLALVELFRKYEKASGAKLNLGKCHGLVLGLWRNCTSFPVAFRWSSSHIVALGSCLNINGNQNWEPQVTKLSSVLNSWQGFSLSFRGCTLIVNVLGLSVFWYLFNIVCVPNELIKKY